MNIIDRVAGIKPIRQIDRAIQKRSRGMARVQSGRAVEVSIEWTENDPLRVVDIIEFAERLKKARTPREAPAKVDWDLVDGQDTYRLVVKGN